MASYSGSNYLTMTSVHPSLQKPKHLWGRRCLDALCIAMALGPVTLNVSGRTPSLYWADPVVVILLLLWLVKGNVAGGATRWTVPRPFLWMVVYVGLVAASVAQADDLLHSVAAAKLLIMPTFVFLITYSFLESSDAVKHLLLALTLLGLYLSVTALLNWSAFNSGRSVLQHGYYAKDMIQTVTGRSNTVAGVNALLVPGALFFGVTGRSWKKLVGLLASGCLIVSIFFAISRGAILAMTGAAILTLLSGSSRKFTKRVLRRYWGIAILVIALIAGSVAFLPEQISKTLEVRFSFLVNQMQSDRNSNSRWVRWVVSLENAKALSLGIGVGNYEQELGGLNTMMGGSTHNLYLETLTELGPLGLFAMTAFLWSISLRFRKLVRAPANPNEALLYRALTMTFLTYLLNVFVEPNYYSPVFTYIAAMIMAAGVFLARRLPEQGRGLHSRSLQLPGWNMIDRRVRSERDPAPPSQFPSNSGVAEATPAAGFES